MSQLDSATAGGRGWPGRQELLDAIDVDAVGKRALAVIDEAEFVKALQGLHGGSLDDMVAVLGMHKAAKINQRMAERILDTLRRSGDVHPLRPLLAPVIIVLHDHGEEGHAETGVDADLDSDPSEEAAARRLAWQRWLRREDAEIHVHLPSAKGEARHMPLAEAIRTIRGQLGSFEQAALVAAVRFGCNPVPAMSMLATCDDEVASAYEDLRAAYPELPVADGTLTRYAASSLDFLRGMSDDLARAGLDTMTIRRELGDHCDSMSTEDIVEAVEAMIQERVKTVEEDEMAGAEIVEGDGTHQGMDGSSDRLEDLLVRLDALDWLAVEISANGIRESLAARTAPAVEDLRLVNAFTRTLHGIRDATVAETGVDVIAAEASMREAIEAARSVEEATALLRAVSELTGPSEHASAIEEVRRLATGGLSSRLDESVLRGLSALHDAVLAGPAAGYKAAEEWRKEIQVGLPESTHSLVFAAHFGQLAFAGPLGEREEPTEVVSAAPPSEEAAVIDEPALDEPVDPEPAAAIVDEAETVDATPRTDGHLAEIQIDEARKDSEELRSASETPAQLACEASACALQASAPTLLTQLICEGRLHTAALVVQHTEPNSPATKALRFFVAAFSTRAESLQFQLPDLVLDSDEIAALSGSDARVLLAGNTRLALDLGYSPTGSLEALRDRAGLSGDLAAAVDECVNLVMRGGRLGGTSAESAGGVPWSWPDIHREASEQVQALRHKKTQFARASKVMHHLARQEQPLGAALAELQRLSADVIAGKATAAPDWASLVEAAQQLRKQPDRIIDQADEAVSTKAQRRQSIVGAPRDRLLTAIAAVAALVERASVMKTRVDLAVEPPLHNAMGLRAAAEKAVTHEVVSPGDAAMQRLLAWIVDGDSSDLQVLHLDLQLQGELELLFEIPRDAGGALLRAPSGAEMDALVDGREPIDAVHGHLASGNRRAAESVLTRFELERTDELDDLIQRSRKDLAAQHREALFAVDQILGRLRALNDDDISRDLEGRAHEHRQGDPDRMDLALTALAQIAADGRQRLDELRADLSARCATIQRTDVRARIVRLIEEEDEALALEFLSLTEAGEELPVLQAPPGDDFSKFFPVVVDKSAKVKSINEAVAVVAEHLGVPASTHEGVRSGVTAWNRITEKRQGSDRTTYFARIADILRSIGLVPASQSWISDRTVTRKAGYATYRVQATPIDASYIPSLGTQAHGSYDVTLVWTEASPQRLLSFVQDDDRTRAQIILYFGTLSSKDRVELRRLTTRPGTAFSPIVVDTAVMAWLAAKPEPGWKLTQRVTLPFTTLNPYAPFAGGEVPAEVFVGRETERAQIVDPTGPMFVYGGRQLGKSALLRRVERGMTSEGTISLYLDLKAAGIGDAAAPDKLWSRLGPCLVERGVVNAQPKLGWNADNVCGAIRQWLEKDGSRRMLLLLDEADNFLTADARDAGPTGHGGFPTLQRLKELMEGSQRRFKPVFAGLHQVQRFHDLPNTPVAHGGQDVLIGPLKPVDARQLVRDPMYALGFEFEDEETMWRLLLFTNYQASLIQIICEALITHMARAATLEHDGGRMVITNRHIDEVYANRQVRDNIALRFRWTINLDPRYRLIAIVAAYRSLETNAANTFSPTELHEECAYWWDEGFSRRTLSRTDFLRYLEEMVGLGVLQRRGDRYALRSPNIIGLLGSRESIEEELAEAAQILQVDYQYNPSMNRRRLQKAGPGEVRAPLADKELVGLLSGHHAVIGTAALGVDRVAEAIEMVASERARQVKRLSPPKLRHVLNRDRGAVLIVDARTVGDLETVAACVHPDSIETVVVVTGPELAEHLPNGFAPVALSKWSSDALQSWQDSPFDTPALRQELMSATGGWPELVEHAMDLIASGSSSDDALATVRWMHSDPTAALEFVRRVGVDPRVVASWTQWFVEGDGDEKRIVPASLDDLKAAGVASDVESLVDLFDLVDAASETEDGWALDGVVTRAAARLSA